MATQEAKSTDPEAQAYGPETDSDLIEHEKGQIGPEPTENGEAVVANSPRPFTTLRWISVCIGLYLTAVLYGLY